jgi:hypothetical protein
MGLENIFDSIKTEFETTLTQYGTKLISARSTGYQSGGIYRVQYTPISQENFNVLQAIRSYECDWIYRVTVNAPTLDLAFLFQCVFLDLAYKNLNARFIPRSSELTTDSELSSTNNSCLEFSVAVTTTCENPYGKPTYEAIPSHDQTVSVL